MKTNKFKTILSCLLVVLMMMSAVLPGYAEPANTSKENDWKGHTRLTSDYQKLSEMLKSEERINWLFTGDSITHGVMWTKGLRPYTEYLEEYFKTTEINGINRKDDLVMNTGVSSATSRDLVNNLSTWMDNKKPDVVVMTFAMNDGRQSTPLIPLDEFKSNLKRAIDNARKIGAIPILQTQNYTSNSADDKYLDVYFNAQREMALENDIILIDFNEHWKTINVDNNMLGDHLHPNEVAHLRWARFILDSLNILNKDSKIMNLKDEDVIVSKLGPDINTENIPYNLIGSQGNSALKSYSIEKLFDGKNYIEKDEDSDLFKDLESSNVTIRVKANAPSSEVNLFSFGNKNGLEKVNLILLNNGRLRINGNFGTSDGYYTCTKNIADGQWHTISLNLEKNKIVLYVDGMLDRALTVNDTASITFNKFNINSVTIGAMRDLNNPKGAGFFSGMIDYVDVYNRPLTADEVKAISPRNSVADEVAPYVNNAGPNLWMFAGGATTEGIGNELSTKNYVQLFQEVSRWEYDSSTLIKRMKFVINEGKTGMSSSDLVDTYSERIAKYSPDILFVMPDIINNGVIVEKNLETFKANMKALIDKAAADECKVILITPASIDDGIKSYVDGLIGVAKENNISFIDVYNYFKDIYSVNSDVKSAWFREDGIVNETGHLAIAKYILGQLNLVPNTSSSRIYNLKYLSGETPNEKGIEEIPVKKDGSSVILDTSSLNDSSYYFISLLQVYEIVEGEERLQKTLQPGTEIVLENIDNNRHEYKVVANIEKNGVLLKTVTYPSIIIPAKSDPDGLDTSFLEFIIDYAEDQIENNNLSGTFPVIVENFYEALNNAKATLNKAISQPDSATQEEIDKDTKDLLDVIHIIDFKSNKAYLEKLVATATEYARDKESYTKATYTEFEKALSVAKSVLADEVAFQDEIDKAWLGLATGLAGLRKIPNKDALKGLLNKARSIDPDKYTASSFGILADATENANIVFNDKNVVVEAVVSTEKALQTAMEGLVPLAGTATDGTVATTKVSDSDKAVKVADTTATAKAVTNAPKTGENSLVVLLFTLLSLSCVVTVVVRKKKAK